MFFEQLKKACDINGIKMTPLIKELGLSSGNVSNWKKGIIPNGKILNLLAMRLGVSVGWLLGETEQELDPCEVDDIYTLYSGLSDESKIKAREYIDLLLLQQKTKK